MESFKTQEGGCLKVGRLKQILNQFDDDIEVYIRKPVKMQIGNISELDQVELGERSFFGHKEKCCIFNTEYSKPEIVNNEGIIECDFVEDK